MSEMAVTDCLPEPGYPDPPIRRKVVRDLVDAPRVLRWWERPGTGA